MSGAGVKETGIAKHYLHRYAFLNLLLHHSYSCFVCATLKMYLLICFLMEYLPHVFCLVFADRVSGIGPELLP